jgi:hypothetical protein
VVCISVLEVSPLPQFWESPPIDAQKCRDVVCNVPTNRPVDFIFNYYFDSLHIFGTEMILFISPPHPRLNRGWGGVPHRASGDRGGWL